MIKTLDELRLKVRKMNPKKIAIAAANDLEVLKVVLEIENEGIAECILVGNQDEIMDLALSNSLAIQPQNVVHAFSEKEAAEKAVKLVIKGEADLIMKGNLATSIFLKAILNKENGLRDKDLLSQISVFEKIDDSALHLITDCAMNIEPDLDDKKKIIENAIVLAHKIGIDLPKVAILTALEVVNPAMQETIDAAVLSKMNDRGQIKGAIIDGPFALDNAISIESAEQKGVMGPVAGKADIILVPDLKTGNVLHKSLVYYANKPNAALVMGAKVPIIMTSRTDSKESKLNSIALACYVV